MSKNDETFDDKIILSFIEGFFGYGNATSAKYVFIGMEEGGKNDFIFLNKKFNSWEEKHKDIPFIDLVQYCNEMEILKFQKRIQPTWGPLIKLIMIAEDTAKYNVVKYQQIVDYQNTEWGTLKGNSCIMELMPLPSANSGNWIYGNYSTIESLKTRVNYMNTFCDKRIKRIKAFLKTIKNPKVVVLYGKGYREHWEKIVEVDKLNTDNAEFQYEPKNNVLYLFVKHPTDKNFQYLDQHIASLMKLHFKKYKQIISDDPAQAKA